MHKFLIRFEVAQFLSGEIEVEAMSREAASAAFYAGDYDELRLAAKLHLEDSEDAIGAVCQVPS